MNIITILLYAHSGIRWAIVVAAVAALILFGYSWLGKKSFPKPARILTVAYSGLLDMQVLLGIILLIMAGSSRERFEHMTMMILAAVLAHLPSRWRKAEKDNLDRNIFLAILGTLILIYLGVAVLPGGWNR